MSFTRRDFVSLAVAGTAATLAPHPLRAQQAGQSAPAPAPSPVFTPLRRNVGIYNERGGTIGWLVNNDGVVVIDSQFADTAPNFLAGLKQRTPRRIDVVINSHHHGDHTGGNTVLKAAANRIVAHARSLENQRAVAESSNAQVTLPDVTFQDAWSVTVGDETVRAQYWGPAHTGGDVSIFFERANIVHLGDLLNNRGYPNIDVPAGASVHGWITVLEKIAAMYPADALYVYGHAEGGHPFIGTRPDVLFQRDYFAAVVEAAGRARRQGRSREELVAMKSLSGFEQVGGQVARLGLALGIAYDELGQRG